MIRILVVIKDERAVAGFWALKERIHPDCVKIRMAGVLTGRDPEKKLTTVRFPEDLGGEMTLPDDQVEIIMLDEGFPPRLIPC